MNYFFLADACFTFQLLFAYLVDLIPLLPRILRCRRGIAGSGVGLPVRRRPLETGPIATAQFGYMVLFSYSFFQMALQGLTVTIGFDRNAGAAHGHDGQGRFVERDSPPASSSRIPFPARRKR